MKPTPKTKDEVLKAFQQLLDAHKKSKNHILTKEEQAKEAQNQKLVDEVAGHTPSSIVKGLADLQLNLGGSVEGLTKQVQTELKKLESLRAAIEVHQANLQETLDAKVAANALYVLKQEQAQREQQLDKAQEDALSKLEKDANERRAEWAKEQAEFENREAEYKLNLDKTRKKEAEDYRYALERKYKLEQDDFENRKKFLVRELEESQKSKDAAWADREKALADSQADLDKYKQKVDNLEKETQDKGNDARDKAMKQTSRECKEAMELLEKEVGGRAKVSDLNIQNLEATIVSQKSELEKLNTELKESLAQVQQLSLKALENNKK